MSGPRGQFDWQSDGINPFEAIGIGKPTTHGSPSGYPKQPPAPAWRRKIWLPRWLALILCLSAIGVIGWIAFDWWFMREVPATSVYVEIKALDENGHPVAGAVVDFGATQGKTDAFGEWRKYLQLVPDQKIAVRISRDGSRGRLVGGKSLVPTVSQLQAKDPKIKLRIRLLNAGKLQRAKAHLESAQGLPDAQVQATALPDRASINPADKRIRLVLTAPGKQLSAVSHKFYRRVKKELFPEVQQALRSAGFRFDKNADLRLRLTYLEYPGRSGVIKVGVAWQEQGQWQQRDFLQNFTREPAVAAAAILNNARLQVPRTHIALRQGKRWVMQQDTLAKFWQLKAGEVLTDKLNLFSTRWDRKQKQLELMVGRDQPCQGQLASCPLLFYTVEQKGPAAGWQRLRLKVVGTTNDASEVYVAGLAATKVGADEYEYWGLPRSRQRFTLIERGKIRFQKAIQARQRGVEIVILPQQNLALR